MPHCPLEKMASAAAKTGGGETMGYLRGCATAYVTQTVTAGYQTIIEVMIRLHFIRDCHGKFQQVMM